MADTKLSIIVDAEDRASATLKGIRGKVEDMQPAFKTMAKVGTVAFAALSGVAITSLRAFADAQKETAIANQALSNAMDDMSTGALNKLQMQIGKGTDMFEYLQGQMAEVGKAAVLMGYDDEEAAQSFARLFQATKDVSQSQKELKLAMDLAAFSGRSLEESADALIKVHAGGARVLKEFGINIKEGATATEAFALLQTKVGGTADALSKTLEGQTRILSIQFQNLQEDIGGALAPALTQLLSTIQPVVTKFAEWAQNNPDLIAKILLVAGGIAGLVAVVGALGIALPALITGIGLLSTALLFLAANPIVLVVAAAVFLAIKLKELIEVTYGVQITWKEVWESMKKLMSPIVDYITGKIESVLAALRALRDAYTTTMNSLKSSVPVFGNSAVGGLGASGYVNPNAGMFGGAFGGSVKDGIVQNGRIVSTDPEDTLIAMKDPSRLGRNNGGATYVIEINGAVLTREAANTLGDILMQRLNLNMRT